MTVTARGRVAVVTAVFGILAAAAGYLFGAPVAATLLVPAMALVIVVMLLASPGAAIGTALLGAAAFLFVQLAAVQQPLAVDFGSGSAPIDLATLLGGAGSTWLPTVVGVACLLVALQLGWWLRRGMAATQPEPAQVQEVVVQTPEPVRMAAAVPEGAPAGAKEIVFPPSPVVVAPSAPVIAAADPVESVEPSSDGETIPEPVERVPAVPRLVRLRMGPSVNGSSGGPRMTTRRLAELVSYNLSEWGDDSYVWSERDTVMVLLLNVDEERAGALAHRLEDASTTQLGRPLESAVTALTAAGATPPPAVAAEPEVRLRGRPVGTRVGARRPRGTR